MTREITAGTILIKNNAVLPKELRFESEPCVPGWRLINDFDGSGLDREVRKTGWTFFCLAGEIKATVFGIDRQKIVRRAIERILANPGSEKFNSMEIKRVASVGSERFPLVRYVTVFAQPRHIQESLFLGSVSTLAELQMKGEPPSQATGIANDESRLSREATQQSGVVSILSR